MLANKRNVDGIFNGWKKDFAETSLFYASSDYAKVCTIIKSETETENYPRFDDVPDMREWLGDRVVNDLSVSNYSLRNKDYELTYALKRTQVEDNTWASQGIHVKQAAYVSATKPDRLVFGELLPNGFDPVKGKCSDGKAFFAANHQVGNGTKSNVLTGSGPTLVNPWFIVDGRMPLKSFIFQDRKQPEFVVMDKIDDEAVFTQGKIRWGVDSRWAAGYGLWQTIVGSTKKFSADSLEEALGLIAGQTNDKGVNLGLMGTMVIFGQSNRADILDVIGIDRIAGGMGNKNYKALELLRTSWLK
jgi:phage major head subunit gpT-like protein